jgi:hypothetical protein
MPDERARRREHADRSDDSAERTGWKHILNTLTDHCGDRIEAATR